MSGTDCSEGPCVPPAERAPRFKLKRRQPGVAPVEWPAREEYEQLLARVLPAFRAGFSTEEFGALALEIHAFQRRWNEPYARWCAARSWPSSWHEIPAVPQAMFKRFRLACFPPELSERTFRTSGTTAETRGEHHLADLRLYEAAVLAGWDRCGFAPHYQLAISQSEADAPDSSLACMWRIIAARAPHHSTFIRADGSLASHQLAHALDCFTTRGRPAPVALLGTALGFLNFFEQQAEFRAVLAEGSYVVETGGFKGSGRDISKAALYSLIQERLGVPAEQIWNEYGMCELGSQFYARGPRGLHTSGPWVRALVVSPETGTEVAVGETGVLRIYDLANVGSVMAVQTADLAIRREHGFELIGRDPSALPRGCSRMVDEMLRVSAAVPAVAVDEPDAPAAECETASEDEALITAERAKAIAAAAQQFDFLSDYTAEALLALVAAELGHVEALDGFAPHAGHRAHAVAPSIILHVFSANTPAAALQSLARGLLLGSRNLCKVPAAGIPELDAFVQALPDALRARVTCSARLPDEWFTLADAVIAFGSDATISAIRARCRAGQAFVPHGHKISLGIFFEPPDDTALAAAARDASVFDQMGCLSPQLYFIRECASCDARGFAQRLAAAMAAYAETHPRGAVSISTANSIQTLRDEIAFRAANGEPVEVLAGDGWTVAIDPGADLPASPLHRTVFVKPLPEDPALLLGPHRAHLSTCGIWPPRPEYAKAAAALGFSRICPVGKMQQPPVAWHHDGRRVLAPLVRWIDYETE